MRVRFLMLGCAFVWLTSLPAIGQERPNIVLVFADDLGWKDVGFQSDGVFLTPNIDRFAQSGMVFSNAYAAAGNCAPSRACLLSGMYTPRHHLFAVGSTNRGPNSLQRLIPVPSRSGLGADFITVAEALKSAGYVTGHFGKWHLDGKHGAKPSAQGFDVTFDSFGDGPRDEGSEGNLTGPPEDPKGVFTLTRRASEFIEAHRHERFFCYLSHHAIHSPLQARPTSRALFAERVSSSGPSANYLACTYDLDASFGMLLDKLRELNLEEDTLVVFTSDNGAVNSSSQEPLRGSKGGYYEGGIREPLIVRWPGVIESGTVCPVPVHNIDLYPTFLAAARAEIPSGTTLDGESLFPLLRQQGALQRQAIFWHFPGYLDSPVNRGRDPVFRTRPVSVIRQGDWKLHLYHEEWQLDGGRAALATNRSIELYNLSTDIGERHDVALIETARRDKLLDQLLEWLEQVEAPLPTEPNPQYDPAASDTGARRGRNRNKAAE